MNKSDVGFTIGFIAMFAVITTMIGVCIHQMFLDVDKWIKIIACIGSHFLLMCDATLVGIFIYLIDWKGED